MRITCITPNCVECGGPMEQITETIATTLETIDRTTLRCKRCGHGINLDYKRRIREYDPDWMHDVSFNA